MNPIISIYDDFFSNPAAVRSAVLAGEFADITNQADGVVYPGISVPPRAVQEELISGVTFIMLSLNAGRVVPGSIFCRATYANMVARNKIHSDVVMGTHAAHVYLSKEWPDGAGTTFFTNKTQGMRHTQDTDVDAVRPNEPADWAKYCSVQAAYNRLLIHRGDAWHLAEPVGGWGTSPADGRLVATMFFTLEQI